MSLPPSNQRPLDRRSSDPNWQRALYLPLTILAWMVIAIVVLWLLRHVTHALLMVILAVIVAFAMAPLVALFRRWLKRPLAVALAYLIGVGLVLGMIVLLVTSAATQVAGLVQDLPGYLGNLQQNLGPRALIFLRPFGINSTNLQDMNQQFLNQLQVAGGVLAAGSLGFARQLVTMLLDVVLVLILSIYFTVDGERSVAWLKEKSPDGLRRYVRYFIAVINQVVGGYVRGTLIMALLIGALVGFGMAIFGVPYAVLLGVLAFFMEFVPVIGVLISGAISLLVTLPLGIGTTLGVLAYFTVVHVIEGDVVGPRIMGKAVGIHPATGIIALLVGTELFGVWGALFGAPLAGLLQAIILGIWYVRKNDPNAPEAVAALVATATKEGEPHVSSSEPAPTQQGAAVPVTGEKRKGNARIF